MHDPTNFDAMTVREFCTRHGVADPVDDFTRLQVEGAAPTVILIAGQPRVTREDASRWRAWMTARSWARRENPA